MNELNINILGFHFTMNIPVFSNKWTESLFILIMTGIMWGVSWLVCILMIKGICWCFDIGYSIKFATGIWLIFMFIQIMVSGLHKS